MDDPAIKGTFHDDNTTKIKGVALQTKYDLKKSGLITLGLNGRREEFDTEGRVRDVSVGNKEYAMRAFQHENALDVYSAALEYEVSPFEKTLFVLGYGHYWQDREEGDNDNDNSFLVGAYYDIFEKTRIRGSIAKKIRFPSIKQLYSEDDGNPDLKTESSYNYELGIEQQLPLNSTVSLVGFLIDARDYIEKIYQDDTFQNNDQYRFQGFEITADTRFVKNLFLGLGYTYLDTEDKSPGTEKQELQYRPKHKLTFEGKYWFDFGLKTYMNIIHVADQVYYSKKEPLEKRTLNNYTLVNLRLDQTLLHGRLHLYLGADNLFDVDYEESYGYPQAGMFIYGGVKVNI
jgi:outer membrane receptor protein involved in Fe transport